MLAAEFPGSDPCPLSGLSTTLSTAVGAPSVDPEHPATPNTAAASSTAPRTR
ncbi:hypothetical protein [Nocardia cyriacigeorgica]|uniref:hypothetical protein n=1 Tax=Nocardia cyriacigeorgica TaxID=135487 RepID=UPI0024563119|nr:hypothetical protein [Nocardia cyriacigeorgica]